MTTSTKTSAVDTVSAALEYYARKGIFRAFSPGPKRAGRQTFRMLWHHDRRFECELDTTKGTLRFLHILPDVESNSRLYRDLKGFLKSKHSEDLPEHRRVDATRAQLRPYNRGGSVSLTIKSLDGDYDYSTRKMVNVIHELFIAFLPESEHYEYMVEAFDLDPDHQ